MSTHGGMIGTEGEGAHDDLDGDDNMVGRKQFDVEEEATGVCFGILLIGGPI